MSPHHSFKQSRALMVRIKNVHDSNTSHHIVWNEKKMWKTVLFSNRSLSIQLSTAHLLKKIEIVSFCQTEIDAKLKVRCSSK
jgi:hypothetical protein